MGLKTAAKKAGTKATTRVFVKAGTKVDLPNTLALISAYALYARGISGALDIVPEHIRKKNFATKMLEFAIGKVLDEISGDDLPIIQQVTLKNAHSKTKLSTFLKNYSPSFPYFPKESGCFVIAKYKKINFGKDLTDYTGIFIDKAANLAQDVPTALSINGHPQVYDDVSNSRNVHIYVFTCSEEDSEKVLGSLRRIFGNDERCYHPTKTLKEDFAELAEYFGFNRKLSELRDAATSDLGNVFASAGHKFDSVKGSITSKLPRSKKQKQLTDNSDKSANCDTPAQIEPPKK